MLYKRVEIDNENFQLHPMRKPQPKETKTLVVTEAEPGVAVTMLDALDTIETSNLWWTSSVMTLEGIDEHSGIPILLVAKPS